MIFQYDGANDLPDDQDSVDQILQSIRCMRLCFDTSQTTPFIGRHMVDQPPPVGSWCDPSRMNIQDVTPAILGVLRLTWLFG